VATTADATRPALTYQYTPSGSATALTADAVVNLAYSLRAPYRQNATFVMSSDTARQIRLLKDGNGGFIWQQGLAAGAPDMLAGRPIVYDENMPSVGAGSFPIAIADWKRAFTIVERPGIKFLQDPYSAKPYVLFYATRRVGGQSSGDFDALKLLRVGTT
jgi:HK97 family phage major capsid protein